MKIVTRKRSDGRVAFVFRRIDSTVNALWAIYSGESGAEIVSGVQFLATQSSFLSRPHSRYDIFCRANVKKVITKKKYNK